MEYIERKWLMWKIKKIAKTGKVEQYVGLTHCDYISQTSGQTDRQVSHVGICDNKVTQINTNYVH